MNSDNVIITAEWREAFVSVEKPNWVAMHFLDALLRHVTGKDSGGIRQCARDLDKYQHYFDITRIEDNRITLKTE